MMSPSLRAKRRVNMFGQDTLNMVCMSKMLSLHVFQIRLRDRLVFPLDTAFCIRRCFFVRRLLLTC